MTDQNTFQNLERDLDAMFAEAPLSDSFVNSLKTQINCKINQRVVRKPSPFYLRPVWIALACLVVALLTTTLIIGPEKVYAEMRRLLGYIPGVGLVDTSAPIRVLAEPVEQTREGVTITVTSATLTADRTQIEYRIFGVPRSAYPDQEDISGCIELEYLLLPDGTKLEHTNEMLPVPADVSEAVLVIPCINNTLPGTVPENWQLPLRFVAAPPELTVMPVTEITPTLTVTSAPSSESTVPPVDTTVSVTQVIETETGYILIGRFAPSSQPGEWVQTTSMPVFTDDNGSNVPYTIASDIDPGGYDIMNGGYGFAYKIDASGVIFPVNLTFSGVIVTQPNPTASVEMPFDFGDTVSPGQKWHPDIDFELDGHTVNLTEIAADSRNGYSFNFLVDPQVYSLGVQIKGVAANGGGGGGGGGLTDGKTHSSLSFAQLPTGMQTLVFSSLSLVSEPLTWHGTWSPDEVRTDLPATNALPEGTCGNAETIQSAAPLPPAITGKALVYEQLEGADQWGLVLYDLDGTNRRVVKLNGSWGNLNADGTKITYPVEGGFEVYDVTSGIITPLTNTGGYNPVWSNDGTRFAFVREASEGVSIMDVTTGMETQVSSLGFETVIGWLPDDSRLIIAAMFSGGSARQIRLVDPLTAAYEDLFVMEDASVKGLNAVLSPDGQWIAYPGRDYQSVHIVSLDGSVNRLLLDNLSMAPSALVWNRQGWLGVSMRQNNSELQKLILINPASCAIYEVPGVTGTLEGLFIE